jgi:hypothetical protein
MWSGRRSIKALFRLGGKVYERRDMLKKIINNSSGQIMIENPLDERRVDMVAYSRILEVFAFTKGPKDF